MHIETGYTFDDLLLIPKHSEVESRDDVDLSVQLPKGIKLGLPLVSANMKTVTGPKMARTIARLGGLAILHRFDYYDVLVDNFKEATAGLNSEGVLGEVGASVGVHENDFELAKNLYKCGCKIFCVDVAHGDHILVTRFISQLRKELGDVLIVAGNVATESGAQTLWNVGADVIKIGIGSGSLCSTRIETGNGYPQLSALDNVCNGYYEPRQGSVGPIFISDGGIKTAGDCVKALAFADLVMLGNLFAGTDEAPGEIISVGGLQYKQYVGSSTHKQKHVEGVIGLVPYRGSVCDVISKIKNKIQSGCSYQGAGNLKDLKKDPRFVSISNSGLIESHPHDVKL